MKIFCVAIISLFLISCGEDKPSNPVSLPLEYEVYFPRKYGKTIDSLYFSNPNSQYITFIKYWTVDRHEPEKSSWDCGIFQSKAFKLEAPKRRN